MTHPSHHAKTKPDHPAYIMGRTGETVTYSMLDARSNQGAHMFRHLGLKRGDSIALMLENIPGLFDICYAAQRSGLIYTCMSTRLSSSEAEYIVKDCGARALIVSAGLTGIAGELRGRAAGVEAFYVMDGALAGFQSWEAAIALMPQTPIADQSAGRDMLYSSGTTGRPKGVKVTLTSEAFDAVAALSTTTATLYGLGEATRYLSPAPLYHARRFRG